LLIIIILYQMIQKPKSMIGLKHLIALSISRQLLTREHMVLANGLWIILSIKSGKKVPLYYGFKAKLDQERLFLLTTIIEDLQQSAPKSVWYHYFDIRDNSGLKSTYRGFLLSLLQQVGSNTHGIHSELSNLYDKCKKGLSTSQATNMEVEETLKNIFNDIGLGYVVIDAMDECQESQAVYRWLNEAECAPNLHIAITSRDHIGRKITSTSKQIFLELGSSGMDDDIALHLDKEIVKCGFKGKLQEEVRESLMAQAHGSGG